MRIVVGQYLGRFSTEPRLAFRSPLAHADGVSKAPAVPELERFTEIHDLAMVAQNAMATHCQSESVGLDRDRVSAVAEESEVQRSTVGRAVEHLDRLDGAQS